MHLSQAVAIIQSQLTVIKGAQVLYSEAVNLTEKNNSTHFCHYRNSILTIIFINLKQNPLNVDIVINMPLDGIRLIFDSVVQRLKALEVYNMKLVKLKY